MTSARSAPLRKFWRAWSLLALGLLTMALSGSAFAAQSLVRTPNSAPAATVDEVDTSARRAPQASKQAKLDEAEEKVAPDSPRAMMADFRHLTHQGDYAGAARYLDLSEVDAAEGPTLAKHLNEVLNRHLWLDLERLSPNAGGHTDDGKPANEEQLGTVPGASGKPEPVLLQRKWHRSGTFWVFSASTVASIESWYSHLENAWLMDHLPRTLLRMGPHLLRWWQWLALLPLLALSWLLAFAITRLTRLIVRRTLSESKANVAHQMRGPATLACSVAIADLALSWLALYRPAENFVQRWLSALFLLSVFWSLWNAVGLSARSVSSSRWAKESTSASSLLSLGTRLAKFAVLALAFVVVLSQLGYQATTIITGLGIGGVALALAAQKTVENLFGTFSLAVDQPFREGDLIAVDTISGTVEAVGLRSTRIRTADRTLICIPNGKLADMRVETINRQDRLRFFCALGLAHTSSAALNAVLAQIEQLLLGEPLVAKDTVGVRLVGLTDSALNLEIGAMLDTTDGVRFMDARQRFLIGMLQIIEQQGCALAHPMRRVELSSTTSSLAADTPATADGAAKARDSASRLSRTG